jgi:hypothetical protein
LGRAAAWPPRMRTVGGVVYSRTPSYEILPEDALLAVREATPRMTLRRRFTDPDGPVVTKLRAEPWDELYGLAVDEALGEVAALNQVAGEAEGIAPVILPDMTLRATPWQMAHSDSVHKDLLQFGRLMETPEVLQRMDSSAVVPWKLTVTFAAQELCMRAMLWPLWEGPTFARNFPLTAFTDPPTVAKVVAESRHVAGLPEIDKALRQSRTNLSRASELAIRTAQRRTKSESL